jgi:hypothetical protein
MTCDEFSRAASQAQRPTAAMLEHAAGCAGCAGLAALDQALRAGGGQPVMSRALAEAVAAPRAARTPFAPWRRALLPAAALVGVLWLTGQVAGRPDLASLPAWAVGLLSLGFVGLFLAGLALLLARGPAGAAASTRARAAYLAVTAAAQLLLSLVWAAEVQGPQPVRRAQLWLGVHVVPHVGDWARHLPCFALGACAAALVLGALLLAAARTALEAPALSGAVAGACAAMGGAFALLFFCSSRSVGHIVGAHGLALSTAVLLGAAAGRRALAP